MSQIERTTRQAFEELGQIREHLTRLQNLAADLEDPTLSMSVRNLIYANTAAMARTERLLNSDRNTTEPADADHHSQHVGGLR